MRPRIGDSSGDFPVDWQFVDEGNSILDIDGGNSFCSSHWDPDRIDGGGIGEVRQLFYPLAKTRMPATLKGRRHCGSDQQWSEGYGPDAPSVTYVDGVPSCCCPDEAAFDCGWDLGYDTTACGCQPDPAAFDYGYDLGYDSPEVG